MSGSFGRADRDTNWRARKTAKSKQPTCRYCKQTGHLIKDCPTRPPRREPRDSVKETPPTPPELTPSEMFWPALKPTLEDKEAPQLQGDWADGSLLDLLQNDSDS